MVTVVRRMNEVIIRHAQLLLTWVTVFGRVYHLVNLCNQPNNSTQPRTPPGSLNRVPAKVGWAKSANVTSPRRR